MNIFVRMELNIDYILLILLSVLPLVFVYSFFSSGSGAHLT